MALAGGMPHWMGWLYAAIAGVAALTDYRSGKIYNWLTLPALGFALVVAACTSLSTLSVAACGMLAASALFMPLFFLGILGGGDVKLLMALGAVVGARGLIELGVASILIAGLGAVALLFIHKRARIFFAEIFLFFKTLLTPGLSLQWPKLNREIKAPFGLAVFWAFLHVWLGGAS